NFICLRPGPHLDAREHEQNNSIAVQTLRFREMHSRVRLYRSRRQGTDSPPVCEAIHDSQWHTATSERTLIWLLALESILLLTSFLAIKICFDFLASQSAWTFAQMRQLLTSYGYNFKVALSSAFSILVL